MVGITVQEGTDAGAIVGMGIITQGTITEEAPDIATGETTITIQIITTTEDPEEFISTGDNR